MSIYPVFLSYILTRCFFRPCTQTFGISPNDGRFGKNAAINFGHRLQPKYFEVQRCSYVNDEYIRYIVTQSYSPQLQSKWIFSRLQPSHQASVTTPV